MDSIPLEYRYSVILFLRSTALSLWYYQFYFYFSRERLHLTWVFKQNYLPFELILRHRLRFSDVWPTKGAFASTNHYSSGSFGYIFGCQSFDYLHYPLGSGAVILWLKLVSPIVSIAFSSYDI